jgi:hypothetical protein
MPENELKIHHIAMLAPGEKWQSPLAIADREALLYGMLTSTGAVLLEIFQNDERVGCWEFTEGHRFDIDYQLVLGDLSVHLSNTGEAVVAVCMDLDCEEDEIEMHTFEISLANGTQGIYAVQFVVERDDKTYASLTDVDAEINGNDQTVVMEIQYQKPVLVSIEPDRVDGVLAEVLKMYNMLHGEGTQIIEDDA